MDVIIEASPCIDVKHTSKAKEELYQLPFEVSRISNKLGGVPEKRFGFWESDQAFEKRMIQWEAAEKVVLFTGWSCKDLIQYQEIRNKTTNTVITFEASEYEVNHQGRKFLFPVLPETIDDFITDLKRIGVALFWKQEIADIYGIDNVTSNQKIIDYYSLIKNFNGSSSQKWQ